MPTLISQPTQIKAAGNKPKIIQEFIGRVNSKTADVSIARMQSPSGWIEPGQTPEFDEYTVVLKGMRDHPCGRVGQVQYARSRRRGIYGRVPAGFFAEHGPQR
jgi:hypothetical protein